MAPQLLNVTNQLTIRRHIDKDSPYAILTRVERLNFNINYLLEKEK
jgi:hypothetical protein